MTVVAIKALVVEDDDRIKDRIEDELLSLGHEFDWAQSQEDAQALLGDNSYDYVLLDLEIPARTGRGGASVQFGLNLAEYIGSTLGKGALPVIVMTSHGDKCINMLGPLNAAGVKEFISKPFPETGRTLAIVIRDVLNRSASAPVATHPTSPRPNAPKLLVFEGSGASARRIPIADLPSSVYETIFPTDTIAAGQTVLWCLAQTVLLGPVTAARWLLRCREPGMLHRPDALGDHLAALGREIHNYDGLLRHYGREISEGAFAVRGDPLCLREWQGAKGEHAIGVALSWARDVYSQYRDLAQRIAHEKSQFIEVKDRTPEARDRGLGQFLLKHADRLPSPPTISRSNFDALTRGVLDCVRLLEQGEHRGAPADPASIKRVAQIKRILDLYAEVANNQAEAADRQAALDAVLGAAAAGPTVAHAAKRDVVIPAPGKDTIDACRRRLMRGQEALQKSQDRLQAALDGEPAPVAATGSEEKIAAAIGRSAVEELGPAIASVADEMTQLARHTFTARADSAPAVGTAPQKEEGTHPSSPQRFQGGELVFYPDHIELCGVTIISDKGLQHSLKVMAELRKQENGRYVRRAGPFLQRLIDAPSLGTITGCVRTIRKNIASRLREELNIECRMEDVLVHVRQGYCLKDWITVRDSAEGGAAPAVPAQAATGRDADSIRRQEWALGRLRAGKPLRRTDLEREFDVSERTAKRDLGELVRQDKVKFVRKPHPGAYRLA